MTTPGVTAEPPPASVAPGAATNGASTAPPRRGRHRNATRPLSLPLPGALAYSGAVLSGLLYWLAFPGRYDSSWHGLIAFVALVPLWIALQGQTVKRATGIGVLTGATMNLAGFYWLLDMLKTFSG